MKIIKKKEEILKDMLDRVDEDYDREEGSLFYDNLAPVSIEFEKLYKKLNYIFLNSFAETAIGGYLDNITKEVGVLRKRATKSKGVVTISGVQGTEIPIGTKVASDTFIYLTTEPATVGSSGNVNVNIESEEYGKMFNIPKNTIVNFPVTIPGLNSVVNRNETTDGYDGESDNELRERYYFKVREPVTSGNVFHYKKWVLEVEGVGNVKVFPLWQGAGTVKVVIVDSEIKAADEPLLERVRSHLEKVRPIGATVTVKSATNKAISISAGILINDNVDFEEVKKEFELKIKNYVKTIGFKQDYVSYAQIGNIILNIQGVSDYKDLRVNDGVINIKLEAEEIPNISSITLQKEVI